MTTLLDTVRLGEHGLRGDKARDVAINGRAFTVGRQACLWLRHLAEDSQLIDQLRRFALAPFDTFTVSYTFPPNENLGEIGVLQIFSHGRYRTLVSQGGKTIVVPGWTWHDGWRIRNETLEKMGDADSILEKAALDHNLLVAFCLIMAQPTSHIVHMGEPKRSRMAAGRLVKFMASSEIVIRLDKPAQLRRLFHTGTHASPRRHEVRRHWWHFGGERNHVHTWEREDDGSGPMKFVCSCGRIRRERGPFERGDAGKGFVAQRYALKMEGDRT